ncbi:MAG: glutamyl-tRNA reductase [Phycisphaerales bacterium]|nr:glutamyl-tRNA reductase [Phycisphaerales bacterium]
MNDLLLIGLNHTTAPLDVRERLALAPQRAFDAITAWQQRSAGGNAGGGEVVLLSTCNRVEIYLAGPVERGAVVDFLADFHATPAAKFETHLYERHGRAAVEHLFAVASGLDSMVLGESQILGQVRTAYETSRSAGATGPVLNPLFQRAATVGKEVLTDTGLGDGRVSVASVAVDYAKRIFDTFSDKTVLCLGTGKMSRLVLQGFTSLKTGKVLVASREQSRADAFAAKFGGRDFSGGDLSIRGVTMDDLDKHLIAADVIIGSTGATHPVVTRERFAGLLKKRRYRPAFFLDIAVPRDIEPAVGDLEGVYLYDLDDLQGVVSQTLAGRTGQVEVARGVVRRHVDAYAAWHRQREIGPLIDALYRHSGDIAKGELDRTLGKLDLDDSGREQVEQLVHRVIQKLLHGPVSQLKQAHEPHNDSRGEGQAYVHAVEKLFNLRPPTDDQAPHGQTVSDPTADDHNTDTDDHG